MSSLHPPLTELLVKSDEVFPWTLVGASSYPFDLSCFQFEVYFQTCQSSEIEERFRMFPESAWDAATFLLAQKTFFLSG